VNDLILAERFKGGDRKAFEELVRKYQKVQSQVAPFCLGDVDGADQYTNPYYCI
jgi:hypothetical protein